MNESAFSSIIERVKEFIARDFPGNCEEEFNAIAIDVFRLQFNSVPAYRKFCERARVVPDKVAWWHDIPVLPIGAFKQVEVTSLEPSRRLRVFESSGTTADRRSRNYHDPESLALYETSVLAGFRTRFAAGVPSRFAFLTPSREAAPSSSLVHMLATLAGQSGSGLHGAFWGRVDSAGNWEVCADDLVESLKFGAPVTMMGTAFNFVHLLDHLAASNQRLKLPEGSIAIETGGYKGRSRSMSKPALYELIEQYLGVRASQIISEYGMCELASQAYDGPSSSPEQRWFRFPHWVRTRIVSPENRDEVSISEVGVLQVFDLANVRSVLAIQTEDLAASTGEGFRLSGRASDVEPRGCSLMTA